MTTANYRLITSAEQLSRFTDRLAGDDTTIGFDIETGYLGATDREKFAVHPETAIIAGISFTNSTNWAVYVPLRHDTGENVDNYEAARALWPLLHAGRGVAHNASFELRHLSRWFLQQLHDDADYGQQVRATGGYFPIRSDTLIEAYLAAEYTSFGLKPLVEAMFGHKMTELWELFPGLPNNKRKYIRFNVLDPYDIKVRDYACEDARWCLEIHRRYHERVSRMQVVDCPCHADAHAGGLLYRVEMAILRVVCDMEDYGVRYDWGFMRRNAEFLETFRDQFNAEIMSELSNMVGQPVVVNLASPAQVADTLYGKLGMKTSVYTAKTRDLPSAERKMSTGKIALERLAKQYPVVRKITEWKEMRRLQGTYLEKYQDLYAYADDGRTHPNHLPYFVVSGRFAVADPPYQQSPKNYHFDLEPARAAHTAHAEAHGPKCGCDEYPPPPGSCFKLNFRDAICAPDDHYILGFDLSQAELRAIAGEAKETALLEAFAGGQDVHTLTAALMLRVPIDQVTKEQRAVGKTMNFALLYGMGVKSLADRLALPVEEAQALYDKYFQVYAGIAAWSAKQVEHGKTYGYVVSRFGRRLPIWDYKSDKSWVYQKGDRACVNYPIQGSATGDYTKIAMVRAYHAIWEAGLSDRIHLVMNVHDALEFYVHRSLTDPAAVIRLLQDQVIFQVPGWPAMQADWHLGARWGSLVEVELTADGRLRVKGEKATEIVPTVEQDEETGEEVLVLPEDVDAQALRAAVDRLSTVEVDPDVVREAATPITAEHDGRHVIVELTDMPAEDGYRRFLRLLDTRPGANTLTVRTPEGDLDLDLVHGTDLHPGDTGAVSMLLGPARIYFDAADVPAGALVADLNL